MSKLIRYTCRVCKKAYSRYQGKGAAGFCSKSCYWSNLKGPIDCNSRIYRTWCGMKRRCYTKNTTGYKYWGGRGITICQEWIDSPGAFIEWALKNGYSDNLTIDRVNVDGMYSPENCRFITLEEQQRNKRPRSKAIAVRV